MCDWDNVKNLGPFICLQAFQDATRFPGGIVSRRRSNISPSWTSHLPSHKKNKNLFFLNIKNLQVHMAASLHGSDIKDHSVYFWSVVSTRWERASSTQKRLTSSGGLRKIFFFFKKKEEKGDVLAISQWREHDQPSTPTQTSAASPLGLIRADRIWPHERPPRPQEVLQKETRVQRGEDSAQGGCCFSLVWVGLVAWFSVCFPAGRVSNKWSRCWFLFPHSGSACFVSEPVEAFDGVGFIKNIPQQGSLTTSLVFAFSAAKRPNFHLFAFLLLAPALGKGCPRTSSALRV